MAQTTDVQASVDGMLRAQAVRTAAALIKKRARAYAKSPVLLDSVSLGLSSAAPETAIAVARHVIMTERNLPRRWFGAGGEIPSINAKAVLLYGRALCRVVSLPSGLGACRQMPKE